MFTFTTTPVDVRTFLKLLFPTAKVSALGEEMPCEKLVELFTPLMDALTNIKEKVTEVRLDTSGTSPLLSFKVEEPGTLPVSLVLRLLPSDYVLYIKFGRQSVPLTIVDSLDVADTYRIIQLFTRLFNEAPNTPRLQKLKQTLTTIVKDILRPLGERELVLSEIRFDTPMLFALSADIENKRLVTNPPFSWAEALIVSPNFNLEQMPEIVHSILEAVSREAGKSITDIAYDLKTGKILAISSFPQAGMKVAVEHEPRGRLGKLTLLLGDYPPPRRASKIIENNFFVEFNNHLFNLLIYRVAKPHEAFTKTWRRVLESLNLSKDKIDYVLKD